MYLKLLLCLVLGSAFYHTFIGLGLNVICGTFPFYSWSIYNNLNAGFLIPI